MTDGKKEEKGKADVVHMATTMVELATTLVKAGAEFGLFPEKRRAGYSELIDKAFASLLDQIEAVRRALREIDEECAQENKDRVVEHLKRLGNSSEWERMERDMRMCAQLRSLHSQMHGFFGEKSDKLAGVSREELLSLINYMIHGGEDRMADYVTEHLASLAATSSRIAKGDLSLKKLRSELEGPIEALTEARKA